MAALAVTRLTLTRFRGYGYLRLELDPRPVVLSGANGAGKTNLLEAVSLLVPGRGLRGARLSEVQQAGGEVGENAAGWAVAAAVMTPSGPVEIGTGIEKIHQNNERERRIVRIDGEPARSQTALADHVACVWLTPQMDRLFIEGAAARRRFLDRLVFGFDPAHAGRLSRYEHALRERARLLRDGVFEPGWLAALEEQMAATGTAVAAARRDVVARLAQAVAAGVGPFPGATLGLDGQLDQWLADRPALAAEDQFKEALLRSRNIDGHSGGAAVGPHRSDFLVCHAVKGAPAANCSTGEQKAMLIALTLANARLLAADRGAAPLLLLDEVAAHLDRTRREALFEAVLGLGCQAWLTGADAEAFAPLAGAAQGFTVSDGSVLALSSG